jgi:hypothetical protein
MIYRVSIQLGDGKPTSIYAHPEWPFVVGPTGDPSSEFRVMFVQLAKGGEPTLQVFRKLADIPGVFARVLPLIHSDEGDIVLMGVDRIADLSVLG